MEFNGAFANRQIIPFGVDTIHGSLINSTFDPSVHDYSVTARIESGQILTFEFSPSPPLPPGSPYIAWTDNEPVPDPDPAGELDPDLKLATADAAGNPIYVNDDSSPLGDGIAPALGGEVNAAGVIALKVGSFHVDSPFAFDPAHTENGTFDLFVRVGDFGFGGDVDFYEFSGLVPGSSFEAETMGDPGLDTILGFFDSSGNEIETVGDGGFGLNSLLRGMVPPDGIAVFAVSGFDDDTLRLFGLHEESGEYTLSLRAAMVPEPTEWLLLGSGAFLIAIGCHRRMRRERGISSPADSLE